MWGRMLLSTAARTDSEVVYQSRIAGDRQCRGLDTVISVTESGIDARSTEESDGTLEFALSHEDVTGLECHGVVRRSITIETDGASYEIPTTMLDEYRFRQAIVERSDLSNSCRRLAVDRLGLCPCAVGSSLGCLLIVAGIGLVLSVFGAVLGVGAIATGTVLLLVAYLSRKVSEWRGSNHWERTNESGTVTVSPP